MHATPTSDDGCSFAHDRGSGSGDDITKSRTSGDYDDEDALQPSAQLVRCRHLQDRRAEHRTDHVCGTSISRGRTAQWRARWRHRTRAIDAPQVHTITTT